MLRERFVVIHSAFLVARERDEAAAHMLISDIILLTQFICYASMQARLLTCVIWLTPT